jgi:hypothetical protein
MLSLNKPVGRSAQQSAPAIRAELIGSDTARSCGIIAQCNSPVLKLCRMLVEAGIDPDQPLHCYRHGMLCLIVRAVAEAAALEINSDGTGFRPVHKPDAAPPMRLNGRGRS